MSATQAVESPEAAPAPAADRPVTLAPSASAEGDAATRPASPRGARYWRTLAPLGVVLGVAVAVVLAHGWRLADLARAFAVFSPGVILVSCGAIATQLLLHSGRLWVVASAVTRTRWPQALRAYAYGQVVNIYLPARMGDVVKTGMLSRASGSEPGRMARAAGAVFIADKALDFVAVSAIVIGSLALSPGRTIAIPTFHVRPAVVLACVLVLLLGAGLLALRPAWGASLRALLASVVQGTSALVSPRRALAGIALSVAARFVEATTLLVLCQAAGLGLGFKQCLWVVVLLNIGTALPVSPANIGTFEASVALAMASMGVPTLGALALATVDHVLQLIVTFSLALVMWLLGRRALRRGRPALSGARSATALRATAEGPGPRAVS